MAPGERLVHVTPSTIPLLEAFERDEGCLMCYLWKKDEFQSMELVEDNEVSMDQAFRKDVVDASGFCNNHMHVLYRTVFGGGIPDGLGFAMYAQDTIEMFQENITGMQTALHDSRKSSWNVLSKERTPQAVIDASPVKLKAKMEGSRICEICRRMLLLDGRRTRTLVDMLNHEDFAGKFAASGKLCLPHFVTAMQMLTTRRVNKPVVAAVLIESELRCLKDVDRLLTEGGKASPEMAASMIAGIDGLYCVTKKSPNPMIQSAPAQSDGRRAGK